ncbi:MAG: non-hydrolyzing UDP-N-acetylglucosamine 2-epimerase [Gemmatimonadota bacterium]
MMEHRTDGEAAPVEPVRVLTVVGTRPEAIKLAPVVRALGTDERVEARLVLTGQHTDLVDQVLDAFRMKPDYDLGIMREGQTLYDVAHGCLDGLRPVVEDFRPEALLVQGDTGTVFYGALVGFFERLRVGHVEAGLRSGRKWAPYPEEMFRRLTDVLSDWYFAPTTHARDNLRREGVDADRIHVTGNTVVDALTEVSGRLGEPENDRLAAVLADGSRRLVLLTAHRRESFGEPIRRVFRAVREAAGRHDDTEILYPVHPNPNVRGPAEEILSGHPRIHLTEPLGYLDLVRALQSATLVLTDSGGIQEEAPTFGVPVLVLRDVTERPEGVEAGVARLVGTDPDRILEEMDRTLTAAPPAGAVTNPYGDGRAGARIADIVVSDLAGVPRRTTDWDGGTP